MSSDLAIRVDGVSKSYVVRHKRHHHVTLTQTALERLKHPLQRDEREEFRAVRDVSFEVERGDVLGIIGRNGAGKSTLLKLLTRITAPTAGRIDLWGRVGSLLEVGTGFHPELTGRENVYLNGLILGMTRREVDRQFDAIVDFASVENFLDTPVKRYSSGMYVRLAFAVAAHLQTEILLVDEVLAVGDAEFQSKCIGKMDEVARGGRTVLLVSHTRSAVEKLATKVLWMEKGSIADFGDPRTVQSRYADESMAGGMRVVDQSDRWRSPSLSHAVEVLAVGIPEESLTIPYGGTLFIDFELLGREAVRDFRLHIGIHELHGDVVGCSFTERIASIDEQQRRRWRAAIGPLPLAPGHYRLSASVGRGDQYSAIEEFDVVMNCGVFEMASEQRADGAAGTNWKPYWGAVNFGEGVLHPLSADKDAR